MKIILPILIALILVSCKKKQFESAITAGDSDAVPDVGYNFLLSGSYTNPKTYQLDLNHDGVNDVEFFNGSALVVSMGVMPEISIKTLHQNMEMNVDIRKDSIFQAYFYHWQYAPGGTRAFFHVNVTSCMKESAQYVPVDVKTTNYLIPMEEGDVLSNNDDFAQGTFHLATAEQHETETEFFPDSTVYHINQIRKSCFEFPENSIRYLGFRITDDDGQKMGWIEVEYLGGNQLRIRDWAIQQ
ncbi:hypothetical protein N9Y60_00600 [Crocinitomicaceae bacterium]|nr:hypothetical protein [Crocinitomicaceae bacterium]